MNAARGGQPAQQGAYTEVPGSMGLGHSDPREVQAAAQRGSEGLRPSNYRGDAQSAPNVSEDEVQQSIKSIIGTNRISSNPVLRVVADRIEAALNVSGPAEG